MVKREFNIIEDGVLPRFYIEAVFNKQKNAFEDVEFVEIILAGDNKTRVVHKVRADHKARFKNAYRAFQEGKAGMAMGTPLENLSELSPATIATMKHQNIHTIEALADVGDNVLPNLGMGARDFREKARRYVDANTVDEEKEELKKRLEILESKLSNKEAPKEEAAKEEEPKKRGRKPAKEVEDLPPHMQG